MDQLAMMENVPRKVKPFKNFTVNSLRFKGAGYDRVKDEIWNHLVKVREDEKQKKEAQMKQQSSSQQSAKIDAKKDSDAKSVSDDDKSSKEGSTNEDKESPSSLPSQKVVTKAVKDMSRRTQMLFNAQGGLFKEWAQSHVKLSVPGDAVSVRVAMSSLCGLVPQVVRSGGIALEF